LFIGDEPEADYLPVPGRRGVKGSAGATGAAGRARVVWLLDDSLADDPILITQRRTLRMVNKGAAWISPSGPLVAASTNIVYVSCPVTGRIMNAKLLTGGGPGACVVDVWKAPFGSFPPLVANSICASALPTITAGVAYSDSTLTGWTTNINAGDVLAFKLSSVSTFTEVSLILQVSQQQ